jgi:hypothetical protein
MAIITISYKVISYKVFVIGLWRVLTERLNVISSYWRIGTHLWDGGIAYAVP